MTTSFGPSYVRAIAPYVAGKPISEVVREMMTELGPLIFQAMQS